jgi:diguanylate cyclase
VSDRIAETVARPIQLRDRQVMTTISIGAAMYPAQAADAEDLMRLADPAMYGRKRRGHGSMLVG